MLSPTHWRMREGWDVIICNCSISSVNIPTGLLRLGDTAFQLFVFLSAWFQCLKTFLVYTTAVKQNFHRGSGYPPQQGGWHLNAPLPLWRRAWGRVKMPKAPIERWVRGLGGRLQHNMFSICPTLLYPGSYDVMPINKAISNQLFTLRSKGRTAAQAILKITTTWFMKYTVNYQRCIVYSQYN